jgi:hypothetical protein
MTMATLAGSMASRILQETLRAAEEATLTTKTTFYQAPGELTMLHRL